MGIQNLLLKYEKMLEITLFSYTLCLKNAYKLNFTKTKS